MDNNGKIGIIHEIGDMGLGFRELSEQEKQQLKEDEINKAKKLESRG